MEAMIKSMLKSMGFDPEIVKAQAEKAMGEYQAIQAQLNRIETLLVTVNEKINTGSN